MGGTTFSTYAKGADVAKAFAQAVNDAQYEYGHGGYSGTIAEKGDYVVIAPEGTMTSNNAYALADRLISARDRRIDDKWGPAGAIPVKSEIRAVQVTLDSVTLPGDRYSEEAQQQLLDAAFEQARRKRLVRRGDKPFNVALTSYETPRRNPYAGYGYSARPSTQVLRNVRVTLTLTKGATALARQTEPDGWLFFGWASC